jgi:hypothetical protein
LRSVRTAMRSPAHPWPQRNPTKSKGSRPGVKGLGCDGWGMSVDQLCAVTLKGLEMDVCSA